MDLNPIAVQKHLKGVEYPATRDDLIAAADINDAPEEIVEALSGLPERDFDGPDDVQGTLS